MSKKRRNRPSIEEARAILTETPTPAQRLQLALSRASGADTSEETRIAVSRQQKDYKERCMEALVATAERHMGAQAAAVELQLKLERHVAKKADEAGDDMSMAEAARLKKMIDKNVGDRVEMFKLLALTPTPASASIDMRSVTINYADLESLPPTDREKLRSLFERVVHGEVQNPDVIDLEKEKNNGRFTSDDDDGGPESS